MIRARNELSVLPSKSFANKNTYNTQADGMSDVA